MGNKDIWFHLLIGSAVSLIMAVASQQIHNRGFHEGYNRLKVMKFRSENQFTEYSSRCDGKDEMLEFCEKETSVLSENMKRCIIRYHEIDGNLSFTGWECI